MKHKTGQFKGASGELLYFQNWQPERETVAALIVVHGFSDHSSRYSNLVQGLVPRGMNIYAFDQLGHGHSPGKRGHIDSFNLFREDLKAFVHNVNDWVQGQPLFLFGHSMGGLIVLSYGLKYPQGISGVIASAPHLSDPPVSPIKSLIGRLLSGVLPSVTINAGLDAKDICREAATVQAYEDDPLVHGKGSPRLSTELAAAVIATQEDAENFQLPLLIYHGSADKLTSPQASRQFFDKVQIENKRYITYEGGFHEGHNDLHQERVVIDVGQWIEEQVFIKSQAAHEGN